MDITQRLEEILMKAHNSKKPCGQCVTCQNVKSIMINFLGYESVDPHNPESNAEFQGNIRAVTVLNLPHRPEEMYLYRFDKTVSQARIDGRRQPSTACAIIAMLFAHKYTLAPCTFRVKQPVMDIPDNIFDLVESAIREGNAIHSVNFEGQPVNLGPEEVSLMTSHMGIKLVYETDVDTREPQTLIRHLMVMNKNQVILFIKNYKVVSLMPCNDNEFILLFDSHPHFSKGSNGMLKEYGSCIFVAKKEEEILEELVIQYDAFCDPIPFYGKFALFDVSY